MKKTLKSALILTALLTLGVVASSGAAQTAAPVAQPTTAPVLTDVPGEHWAADAVKLLVTRGVILGYPDGSFRGQQPITRYEISQILARVLQQNLIETSAARGTLSRADLDVIARGVQEVADMLGTIDVRLRDAVTDIDTLKARMANTEQALQQVVAVAVTRTELEASAAATAAAASTETQTGLASKADTSALVEVQGQVNTLKGQVGTLETNAAAATEAAKAAELSATEQQALNKAAGINGQVFKDPNGIPNADFKADNFSTLYAGGGVGFNLGSGVGFAVVVGSDRVLPVLGGLGLRVSGTYSGGARSYSVQGNVTKTFNVANDGKSNFSPYAGLGGGVMVSPDGTDNTLAANDSFISALGGLNYNFTETLRLYLEADGRYYLGAKGTVTGATAEKLGSRVGVGLGAGLKIYF